MDHEIFLSLQDITEKQRYIILSISYLIDKQVLPPLKQLEEWGKAQEEKEKKEK